jgi:hypothetical protein
MCAENYEEGNAVAPPVRVYLTPDCKQHPYNQTVSMRQLFSIAWQDY